MYGRSLRLVLVVVFVVAIAVACGGGSKTATTAPRTTTAARLSLKATFVAPNHHPVVNKNWPITVTVTSLSGKPIAATLQMNVLFGGAQVGQIDNGKIYHFVGRHHENITWPARAVGAKLVLQSVVTVKGKTKKLLWSVSVVNR